MKQINPDKIVHTWNLQFFDLICATNTSLVLRIDMRARTETKIDYILDPIRASLTQAIKSSQDTGDNSN